eukprot:TRINITY_DN2430_c0_g1_i2.p1 TRINITY_DN2430_c0_g1~~TRINITY_DN2430_c0_g1_i2.p1  ORF type:complete len:412 (+),score=128.84 TRINITY_DN2430_c0_g1_i2:24-1238(+)
MRACVRACVCVHVCGCECVYACVCGAESVLKRGPHAAEMLLNGRAPKAGEVMRLPSLARTFRALAADGADGFYKGRVAQSIVDLVQSLGGSMTLEDLASHRSTFDQPISVNYRGVDVWEMPPNGQGITALLALKILDGFDLASLPHNSPEHLHLLIEAMRLAFADTRYYCADPSCVAVPVAELLSDQYAAERRSLIAPERASVDVQRGSPVNASNTVYFCVVDPAGNACSFINSNYMGFGTGLIPEGCGFTLQNRGANFSLDPAHPNALAPGKRPYHTIIPGMATKDGQLWCPFGVMGGFMQPQGHVQVLVNMLDHGMDPQAALDAPRFQIPSGTSNGGLIFEQGISAETSGRLAGMGHRVDHAVYKGTSRAAFGYGQIIGRDAATGVLWAGSDCRADGCAMGF